MGLLLTFVPLAILAGIAYAVYTLVQRSRNHIGAESGDASDVAKSVAIHGGLFLSFVAVAVGLIDLLQVFVQDGRLAGSNSDLARALSFLIVGVPAFGLLLRAAENRHRSRSLDGAAPEPGVGWTAYLVAALTTSLIGSLVSIWEIADRVSGSIDGFEPSELVVLLVWATLWFVHWFVLRVRFGILGDLHLAIGSIIGLAWMVGGLGGVVLRVLERGYGSAFNTDLASEIDWAHWLTVGFTGALVWAWHWLGHFNRPTAIEGDCRQSALWYLTAVGAGVLPGLLAMIVTATAAISGLLVWFIGTTNQGAAEYFEPTAAIVTTSVVGFVLWAYHHWLIDSAATSQRNEALRFHDYSVVGLALLGTVAGTAGVLTILIDTITTREILAGTAQLPNGLIVTLSILAVSASVWWWRWSKVERHRSRAPLPEVSSISRKLYLVIASGIGGLVLAICLISLLFIFLRDLLDGDLTRDTIEDLTLPISWGLAVAGGFWYHLGIWRADRATTAMFAPSPVTQPPPPQPHSGSATTLVPAPVVLRTSRAGDLGELFTLQRAAFVDEAKTYETPDVPTLNETLAEMQQRLAGSDTIVAVAGGRIVGSVSMRRWRDGGHDIERLMIAPDQRRRGIASQLLDAAEAQLVSHGESSVQLIVGEIVTEARALYDARGYELVDRTQAPGGPALLTVRKVLAAG